MTNQIHGTPTVSYGLEQLVVDSSIWALEIQQTIIDQPPPSLGGDPDPEEQNNQPSPDQEGEPDIDFDGEEDGRNEPEPDFNGGDGDPFDGATPDDEAFDFPPKGNEIQGLEDKDSLLLEGDSGHGDEENKVPSPQWTLDAPPTPKKILPGLITLEGHPNLILREFHDFWSFIEAATDESLYAWNARGLRATHSSHWSGEVGKSNPWHGTETWEEAVDMALGRGWPEGRALLSEAMIAVSARPSPYESLEFSVAGAFPAVPNYCAGDPECMVIDPGSTLRNPKPVVTIDYNHWISASVPTSAMMLRGAAVLSLANTLEQRGISTILRIVGATRSIQTWAYTIVFKKAGEFLDLDRAAFAIAHPACMRRLAFALLEQHADLKDEMSHGYGSPTYSNPIPDSTAIYIPGADGAETPDSARKVVEQIARSTLGTEYLSKEIA